MRIDLKKYKLKTDKKVCVKIAHISDIHFSLGFNLKRLDIILDKIKKGSFDYVCITGDLIDIHNITRDEFFVYFEKFLNDLSLICKVIISIGNHEYIEQLSDSYGICDDVSWLKKIKNVIVLDDDIYRCNNINFVGFNPSIKYYKDREREILSEDNLRLYKLINKLDDGYNILLCHTPTFFYQSDNYKKIKDFGKLNLILCGHTHGGMIPSFLPGNFGIISPTKKLFPSNVRGKKIINGVVIIISSGITKLSRKSKLMKFTDIYGENINEIEINC